MMVHICRSDAESTDDFNDKSSSTDLSGAFAIFSNLKFLHFKCKSLLVFCYVCVK